jgi:hypothetical protein
VAVEIAERIKNCLSITPECSFEDGPAWKELVVGVTFIAALAGSKDDGASGIAASPPALAAKGYSRTKTAAQKIALRMHFIERPLTAKHCITFVTRSSRSC